MEITDVKTLSDPDGLQKSAIIYRDDSAHFIYVCFHCGRMFNEINETLRHIESHFQLANVVVDQFTEDAKEENSDDCVAIASANTETVDIKIEILDNSGIDNTSDPMIEDDKREFCCKVCNSIQPSIFLFRVHVLNVHIREPMQCCHCTDSFRRSSNFENHLKGHIAKGEVNWKSVTEGIQTVMEVDWSTYEDVERIDLEHDDDVMKEEAKRIPSSEGLTIAKRSRKKQATARVYDRPYRCHKCSQTCRSMNVLRTHLKTHTDEDLFKIYKCKQCDCFYKNAYALRVHVLEVHLSTNRFSCNACSVPFNFTQNKEFEEHLQLHKLWTDIRDGIYHEKSLGSDYSKYEETNSFTEEQFSCEFCTQRFYLKCNLDVHMKSVHSGQRRLQCSECFSIFTTPKYYFAHQLEHQRVGPIIVERDDNVLLANLDACIDERIIYDKDEYSKQSYRCLICNTTFDVNYDIRSHIRERHVYKMFPPPMEPKKEFICDVCGMRLKTKAAVKNHLLIHTDTKSHACTLCGKKFRQNSDRRIHERQHTGEKPFQCHECGKAFISRGLLTAHKKSHDDTTYPCPICGRVFNLPSGYRKHIQTHRQDRSFKCTICTKSFNTRIYLTKHMSIHSDKQYQCRFCECKFSTSDGQRQHQRHKHKYASS